MAVRQQGWADAHWRSSTPVIGRGGPAPGACRPDVPGRGGPDRGHGGWREVGRGGPPVVRSRSSLSLRLIEQSVNQWQAASMSLDFTAINPSAARAGAAPHSPSGDLPSRAQYVVVGGGVIGTSIAYHLASWVRPTWCCSSASSSPPAPPGTRRVRWSPAARPRMRCGCALLRRALRTAGGGDGALHRVPPVRLPPARHVGPRRREPAPRDGVHALGRDDQGRAVAPGRWPTWCL